VKFGWTWQEIQSTPMGVLALLIRAVRKSNGEEIGMTLRDLEFGERLDAAGIASIADATPEQLEKVYGD